MAISVDNEARDEVVLTSEQNGSEWIEDLTPVRTREAQRRLPEVPRFQKVRLRTEFDILEVENTS